MNVSCVQELVAGYEQRLRSMQRVALFSYGRRILRDDGRPNRFFFYNLSNDRETAIEVGLIRNKMPCKTCGQDMAWSADSNVREGFPLHVTIFG
jgi:hypothetical protein